ncbi:protein SCO1/2 [Shimia gijangensis]|uniref:Protein SCO1/2 n=1 Tax=Shimia gijangensis TaxID=1470563 RepID=A0A1M6MU30_9RHOB|nr:SCO family protein [Shimia gijangensis]SHJ86981.1 protein SCO1/2 [Shimia gijangensis]
MIRNIAVIAIAVVILALGGTWFLSRGEADPLAQCRVGAVAGGQAAIGGPFELVDEDGATVTDIDVITEPSILYFGYTFCPDVCPMDTSRNAEAVEILEDRGIMVKPVFISIDPARDTPEVVKEFTDVMHPRMLGLTGTPAQVKAASQAYRTYYKKQDGDDEEYYLVDHSTYSYLVFPEVGFVDFFKRDETPEQMANRIGCFIENM